MSAESLQESFAAIHAASRRHIIVDWATRQHRLQQLLLLLKEQQHAITAAIAEDFGQRNPIETSVLELIPSTQAIQHALKHGKKWMRKRPVKTSWLFLPASNHVLPQPKGVIGIVVPWNYPLFLTIGPLVDALVAGNRAMIKLSEHAPVFAALMARIIPLYFQDDEVNMVTGGAEVAAAFCALPFDHLLFTGSTAIGKHVMQAAAPNLTPVTLELGGKSPVLIHDVRHLQQAVARIMYGKMVNAGQTCIAPDYLLIHHTLLDDFVAAAQAWFAKTYPKWEQNSDFTHIINTQQNQRLQAYLDEAQIQGARIMALAPAKEGLIAPSLVIDAPNHCALMQEEIFGPILPIVTTASLDDSIHYINARPRPLACYVFSQDSAVQERCLQEIVAGGMCINEVLLHVAQDGLPFGGIGPSGMGAYHGKTGFDSLSHLKAVLVQKRFNTMGLMGPPYGVVIRSLLKILKP
ncbi:coniferyl aldehyde dehydrogenase [Vitreoscilla sp. C1]|uniref:coniferyl aldehyde dehydrogenase n=1 Tax=Vitreoscilla sp. (strain C1) TaxID=96942 RepID=UPI00148ED0C5|nr:coniferyl aldehyde dehydrogenase [Vitreoscilla sp. C1]